LSISSKEKGYRKRENRKPQLLYRNDDQGGGVLTKNLKKKKDQKGSKKKGALPLIGTKQETVLEKSEKKSPSHKRWRGKD